MEVLLSASPLIEESEPGVTMQPGNDLRNRSRPRLINAAAASLMLLIAVSTARAQQPSPSEQLPAGFAEKSATVDGVKLAYKIGGTGLLSLVRAQAEDALPRADRSCWKRLQPR
jgi:hypothetical protein